VVGAMRDTVFIAGGVMKFMAVNVLRQCTHLLLINVDWDEGEARKVEYIDARSRGKKLSIVLNVLGLNFIAKFGWVACLNNVTSQFLQHVKHTTSLQRPAG
jgi:hypothetical protein